MSSDIHLVSNHNQVETGDFLIHREETDGETMTMRVGKHCGEETALSLLSLAIQGAITQGSKLSFRLVKYDSPLKQILIREVTVK